MTDERPLISVIVPAYNAAAYLSRCLDSLVMQSYPNIEIVVVDDGSTDSTKKIADEYVAKAYKMIVVHQDNQGVSAARLAGINAASGEWIGFTDADDVAMSDMYERLYQNAIRHHADVSHCGHKTIVEDGKREHDFCNEGRLVCQNSTEALKDLLKGSFEPSLWTKLFRRDVVERTLDSQKIDTSIVFNEDLLLNYFLFGESAKSVFDDFCGYHYMAHPNSATRGVFNINRVLNPLRVRKIILEKAEGELKVIALGKYLTSCMMAFAELSILPEYEEEANAIRRELNCYRNDWRLMRRNDLIKLKLLMMSPNLYRAIYGFYERNLQVKRYE